MHIADIALRFAAISVLMLFAALLLRAHWRRPVGPLGALYLFGIIGCLLCPPIAREWNLGWVEVTFFIALFRRGGLFLVVQPRHVRRFLSPPPLSRRRHSRRRRLWPGVALRRQPRDCVWLGRRCRQENLHSDPANPVAWFRRPGARPGANRPVRRFGGTTPTLPRHRHRPLRHVHRDRRHH